MKWAIFYYAKDPKDIGEKLFEAECFKDAKLFAYDFIEKLNKENKLKTNNFSLVADGR